MKARPGSEARRPIGIGLIGCGHWGPNHLRVFHSLAESRVVAAADKDSGRLQHLRQTWPALRCWAEHREVLADRDVDAVVVATPTATHYQLAKDSLAAGKHVLCEKPLCLAAKEGAELVELARRRRRILMVGHVFLFNPGIIKLKELLDSGELGQPRHLFAVRTNLGPVRSDVNAAYDLAAHDISIFNWLLAAEPEVVAAMGASFLQPGIEDVVVISMKYPGNVLANIQSSWLDPKKVRQITLVGSRKMATWDDLDLTTPVAIYEKGVQARQEFSDYGEFLRLSTWEGDVRLPKITQDEPLKKQAQCFLAAIRDGRLAISNGEFAVKVVRTLEKVNRSLAANTAG